MTRSPLHRILRSPFLFALLPSALFYTVILSRNWIPIHDTLWATHTAYFALNELITHHAVSLWFPFINYGIDTNWILPLTFGPSLATLSAVARILNRGDLLQYFYLALFLDELVLLAGTYLLARFLFRRRLTVVFVCIAMTGSTLWFAQPWFNFHLYYFVPLSAYFVLTGCARNDLWRVLAGGLVLLVSEFGNIPYYPVMHALTYALLVAGAWWAYRFDVRSALSRAGVRELTVLAACVLTAAVYLTFLAYGVSHINYDIGRTRSAVVGAEDFLTYGGAVGLAKFAELITGVSWDVDANAYAGALMLGFAVFGMVWAPERRMVPFVGAAVFLGLLSLGKDSFVAPLIYEIPGVAYYRHIGLVLPLVKVMLIVLSGFGVDALLRAGEDAGDASRSLARRAYFSTAVILALMLVAALVLTTVAAISLVSFGHQYVFPKLSDGTTGFEGVQQLLHRAAFVAIMYLCAIGVLIAASLRKRTTATVVGALLLAIQTVDVYSYRVSEFQKHMVPIDADYRRLFGFTDRGFIPQRTRDPMSNATFRIVASHFSVPITRDWYNRCSLPKGMHCYYDFDAGREGVLYNTIEPFAGLDPCRSIFRVDYWLGDVDRFYRAATGMPLRDLSALPRGYEQHRLYFPVEDARVDKAVGCEFPKLQVFSSVSVIGDERRMARLMDDSRSEGDLLLVSGPDYKAYLAQKGAAAAMEAKGDQAEVRPDANARVGGQIRVLRATDNTVVVRTVLPSSAAGYWLYYADAWHPFWHAQVNGREVPILRANFGFKAVEVPGGNATVTFAYRSGVLSSMVAVAAVLLIATTLTVVGLAIHLLIYP